MKMWIYYGVIMALLLALSAWLIQLADARDEECKRRGGLLVKTQNDGFVCMDSLKKIPLD